MPAGGRLSPRLPEPNRQSFSAAWPDSLLEHRGNILAGRGKTREIFFRGFIFKVHGVRTNEAGLNKTRIAKVLHLSRCIGIKRILNFKFLVTIRSNVRIYHAFAGNYVCFCENSPFPRRSSRPSPNTLMSL